MSRKKAAAASERDTTIGSTTSAETLLSGPLANDGKTNGSNAPQKDKRTDFTRWRMLDEDGRQTWHYLEDDKEAEAWPQTFADKYFLGLPTVSTLFDYGTSY